ncbi:MAG: DUF3108 domain-containing protein [Gemmatimonadota bacterium]|nr:DUF3108 domain-containing protein [Gemmatimonadota bacterium]
MNGRAATATALLLWGVPLGASGQDGARAPAFAPTWPFAAGETAVYDVTVGPVRVGRAVLAVEGEEVVRGIETVRLAFEVSGGPFFYKIDDRNVSWLATDPYATVRFEQILHQGSYERHRRYELDPATLTYDREDWDEDEDAYRPHHEEVGIEIPEGALDEISFLFLARTLPLEVGRTYTFENYFQEDGNPVVVQVLRRENVRVRAGRFDTIVVRPIIRSGGLFAEEGEAELYISDDDERRIVQLKSRMRAGQMSMYLREFESGRR